MKLTSIETLRALMRQRGFSMQRLARYAGCSKSFIGHLCSGRKTTCTPQLAVRIAEALDVPVDLIFVVYGSADSGRNSRTKRISAA
ncbi:helix-turn-helix transcriptional regulator [Tsukamurella sputi]|uniref:Helix-turn-helix transcriptional regulator n=1 Tax=Tsukamurella sputi TaxID=2591848 RepID=A0A5C5RSI2_9ACTN|nr:helix-turn-helix transcriptional regulator [Tsukamurella sputi]TWS25393.1 helix-turn-helix transcriptional regulator [Tsukamurella sputi]